MTHPTLRVIVLTTAALLAACGSPPVGAPLPEMPARGIRLERTACFGACPIYVVTLDSGGGARYRGEMYVTNVGTYTGTFDPAVFATLTARLHEAGFSLMQDRYSVPVTDLPAMILTVSFADTTKRVWDYGDAGPAVLDSLAKSIDSLVATISWRRSR